MTIAPLAIHELTDWDFRFLNSQARMKNFVIDERLGSQMSNVELDAFANIDHGRNEFSAGVPHVGRVAQAFA